jgi:ferritin-like metal-binding protein YciE
MKLKSMQDLYVSELKDLYSAETQLLKALPKMAKAASSDTLREAIEEHIQVTEKQKQRIEQIAEEMDFKPGGRKCKAMEGLIHEGEEALQADSEPAVQDAAIIAAAQRIEHYEIAAYGTARTIARTLGYDNAAQLLQQTLDEESSTDQVLTDIAETQVNPQAANAV